jgi:hypothetical protein
MGAALEGSGVQASGMWPSPASKPEVGVQANPAAAGQINFRPGVQVGEILFRAARAVERFHVGLELDEITADEARREAAMPEQLAQQPRGIAARTAQFHERLLRRLHAGFEADGVFDVLPQALIDGDEKINRAQLFAVSGIPAAPFSSGVGFAEKIASDGW